MSGKLVSKRGWCNPGSSKAEHHFNGHLFRESDTCERCGITRKAATRARARAKSGRIDVEGRMHFALVKSVDHDAKSGTRITALTAATRLLEAGFWPLWEHTPSRIVVDAGDRVCIYLSGSGTVVASAHIQKVQQWTRTFADAYPLMLGGTPELVLSLVDINIFARPIAVASLVGQLNCVGANKKKWGAAFCGGMRSLTAHDYSLLTTRAEID